MFFLWSEEKKKEKGKGKVYIDFGFVKEMPII